MPSLLKRLRAAPIFSPIPAFKPIAVGTVAAIAFGLMFDVGPWDTITGRLLGTADAQEALPQTGRVAEPSEADRAALRYFASRGETERLEAELRRLRALYPGWTPPRDLLDPGGEDLELQRIYELVGEQDYAEARRLLNDRQRRDPTFVTPPRLAALLRLAEARGELRAASDEGNFPRVLQIAEENEQILTCEDPDSIWRVAEAFAETGRPQRAFDAYTYIMDTCDDLPTQAATLQKAAEELDTSYITRLFDYVTVGQDGEITPLVAAQLNIIRGLVAQAGQENAQGIIVPQGWIQILADYARTGAQLEDAMLIGYYLYRQGNPTEAALWFRFALDNGLGSDAAEGYIIALRATGVREDQFLAREVAYQWREQSPELMESYLDAMATVLTADRLGSTSFEDVEQDSVNRFVPVVIQQRDPNGAQALGWYAFNTCQFIIAEEWFISSANWVPTEAALFGLALSRLRLGDQEGFNEVVDEWGPLYESVQTLATGIGDPTPPPPAQSADDVSDEVGVDSVVCDPEERERLRQLIVEQQRRAVDPVAFTQAGSLTAAQVRPMGRRPDGSARPEIPRRSVVIDPAHRPSRSLFQRVQLAVPQPTPTLQQDAPQPVLPQPTTDAQMPGPVGAPPPPVGAGPAPRTIEMRRTPVTRGPAPTATPQRTVTASPTPLPGRTTSTSTTTIVTPDGSTVTRRVRQGVTGQAIRPRSTTDARVREIVRRPGGSTGGGGGGGAGGTAAQRALTSKQYSRCVAITDAGIRRGVLSAEDASARGFCLLQLERPVEAAQAFQLARVASRLGTNQRADAVYGSTLAYLANNMTAEAAIEATRAPLSRPRRTELQTQILTQRALAANRDGRTIETLYFLDQRNRIAPLQKDLMLLQGFAYRDAGNIQAAQRIFEALDKAGSTSGTRGGLIAVAEGNKRPIGGAIIRY